VIYFAVLSLVWAFDPEMTIVGVAVAIGVYAAIAFLVLWLGIVIRIAAEGSRTDYNWVAIGRAERESRRRRRAREQAARENEILLTDVAPTEAEGDEKSGRETQESEILLTHVVPPVIAREGMGPVRDDRGPPVAAVIDGGRKPTMNVWDQEQNQALVARTYLVSNIFFVIYAWKLAYLGAWPFVDPPDWSDWALLALAGVLLVAIYLPIGPRNRPTWRVLLASAGMVIAVCGGFLEAIAEAGQQDIIGQVLVWLGTVAFLIGSVLWARRGRVLAAPPKGPVGPVS